MTKKCDFFESRQEFVADEPLDIEVREGFWSMLS